MIPPSDDVSFGLGLLLGWELGRWLWDHIIKGAVG